MNERSPGKRPELLATKSQIEKKMGLLFARILTVSVPSTVLSMAANENEWPVIQERIIQGGVYAGTVYSLIQVARIANLNRKLETIERREKIAEFKENEIKKTDQARR